MKDKLKRFKGFWTKRNVVYTIVGVFFLGNFIQIHRTLGTFGYLEGTSSSLIEELGGIKGAYQEMGTDLAEVRKFLRLPVGTYASGGFLEPEAAEEDEGANGDKLQLAIFDYIDFLGSQKVLKVDLERNRGYLDGLSGAQSFRDFLAAGGLASSEAGEFEGKYSFAVKSGEDVLVSYVLDLSNGEFQRISLMEAEALEPESLKAFENSEVKFLRENVKSLRGHLKKLGEQRAILSGLLEGEDLKVLKEELQIGIDTGSGVVVNKLQEPIGEIKLNDKSGNFDLVDLKNGKNSREAGNLRKEIAGFLRSLETMSFLEKKYAEALSSVEKTVKDKGFKLLLSESGLAVGQKREDENRVYFDMMIAKSGAVLGSIVIEKATGVVNVTDPNGANSENVLMFDPDFKKKTLEIPEYVPEYGDERISEDGTFNILIAGKHGSLLDTMIFAHLDEKAKTVNMVSIPRDLFYNGRKINAYASMYGMPEMVKAVSKISGYELDKFVLIDMYAFIDVVNLIGGVDLTLEKAVVDPTYRTVDNGVEGTLNYPAGDYHLGGKEALRLARTRHTSSDFARAERQQMIIEAIQKKVRSLGFSDANTVYALAKTVLSKVETDVSFDDALAYYFKYQDYKIVSNAVMSSGNILYVPPYIRKETCDAQIAEAAASGAVRPTCDQENQAYTLAPRDNNWNLIKWFFREEFEG